MRPLDLGIGRLFEQVRDAVIVADVDSGQVVLWNPAAAQLFGYPADEILGRPVEVLIPEAYRAAYRTGFERYRATGHGAAIDASVPLEVAGLRRDGAEFPIEMTLSPLDGARVSGRFVLAIIRDAGARRRAEAERAALLRAEGARGEAGAARRELDAILAGVQDGITVQDTAGRLIYANLAAAQMVGFASPEALLAAPLDAVLRRFELFDEHGAPFPVERLPGRLALQGERGHEAIVRYRIAATGEERWAVVRATPLLDAAGRVTRAVNVFQDVTEQRRAEEALRFLAEASRELAGSLDYETTVANVARLAVSHLADWCAVVIAEDGALRVIAVAHADPRQAALARELQERYPFYPELPYGTARVVQTGAPELYPEIDLETSIAAMKDAEQARLVQALGLTSAMIVPLRTREGCRGAMTFATAQSGRRYTAADLALAQDVADRCALAIENARLYSQAQAAVSQRDEFLSVAAHELKTPVTSLRGFAHVALRQLERDEQPDVDLIRRALAVVDEQTAKLSRLVTRLLDRSRIESGQLALEPAATDLVPLLESVVSAARMTTRQHALELRATGPLVALVDALRLEQVVRNLVDNAIKYSPAGSAIEVELVAPDAEIVRVAVRDYGPGIPPEHRDRIFERFYQVREGKAPAGMGLGLYLSRRIAELHGGQLAAEFPPDGGTRFVLTLPRAGRQGEMAPAAELAHHARDAVQ